jgi:hypothetical protein
VSQGLPITQLELATMAFVVCALIMYMLWWDKPFGVDRRTVLTAITYDWKDDEGAPGELRRQLFPWEAPLRLYPVYRDTHTPDLTWEEFGKLTLRLSSFTPDKMKKIVYAFGGMVGHIFGRPNLIYPPQDETRSITFYATGTVFSAFHLGAWNWEFPSSIVRTLWRSFALAATGTGPAAIFLISLYMIIIVPKFYNRFRPIIIALLVLLALTYVISRLALMVLIFYCFSSMPAGVYETVDWTKFLPHFS